jgi:hypothetical protein
MTPRELDEIEARAKAATEGPWAAILDWGEIKSCNNFTAIASMPEGDDRPEDFEFMANARSDVPALVAEVRRLLAENQELREALTPLKQASSRRNVRPRVDRTPPEAFPQFAGEKKSCPRCGRTGDILEEFGIRLSRGKHIPASWCRKCRSETSDP